MDREWNDTDYPTDDALTSAAKRLYKAAVGARVGHELHLIPLGHDQSIWAGNNAGTAPVEEIAYSDETDYTWTYYAGRKPDGTFLGTAEDWYTVETELDWIEGFLTNRILPEPVLVDNTVAALTNTAVSLWENQSGVQIADDGELIEEPSNAMNAYTDGNGFISNWEGIAGNRFRTQLWNRIPPTFSNQAALANAMAYILTAYRDLLYQHRVDTKNLINETVNALQALAVNEGSKWPIPLSMIAAVATIAAGAAAFPLTGGAAIAPAGAAGLTMLAGASALPLAQVPGEEIEEPQFDIEADTVNGILGQMVDCANRLQEGFDGKERLLVIALNKNYAIMEAATNANSRFIMPRPTLVGDSERVIDQLDLDTERFDSQIR